MNVRFLTVVSLLVLIALPSTAISEVFTTVTQEYMKAKKLFQQGKIKEARKAWRNLLVKRSYELEAKHKSALKKCIADCNLILKKRAEALKSNVDRAFECCESAKPLLRAYLPTEVQEKEDTLRKAVSYLKKSSVREKKDPRYNYLYAFSYLHLDLPDKAAPYVEKAIEAMPKDPRPHALRAALLWQQDEYDLALDAAEVSIALQDEGNSDAYYWKVRTLLSRNQQGDPRQAWQLTKRAIGKDEKRAEELSNLFPDPRMKKYLQDYTRKLVNERKRAEIAADRKAGPKVISAGGTGRGGVTRGSAGSLGGTGHRGGFRRG